MKLELTSDWSLPNSRVLADVCARAYKEATISNTALDVHALVLCLANCDVIAFRGTASVKDFLLDADFERIYTDDFGGIHRGFWRGLDAISSELHTALQRLDGEMPIFVTGHSLGGALARLFFLTMLTGHLDAPISSPTKAFLMTFGEPRGGDDKYAQVCMSRCPGIRVVNSGDPVPKMPPIFSGYAHSGVEALLTSGPGGLGSVLVRPTLVEEIHEDISEKLEALKAGNLDPLAPHHIDAYRERLAALT
jgi:hypothetical protein